MTSRKIINLAEPTNPQDMATKAYADYMLGGGADQPADIPIIAWVFSARGSESALRAQYQSLLNLGINGVLSQRHLSHDPYDFRKTTAYYDLIFNVAAEMNIKVYWYGGLHRLHYVNQPTGKHFLEFAKDYSAWGGWEWGDEPNYMSQEGGCNWPHSELQDHADMAKGQDPDCPYFAVWGYDLSVCYSQTYSGSSPPYGCGLFNLGCECIYPTRLWGTEADPCVTRNGKFNYTKPGENPFAYWIHYGMHMPHNDGFADCGKGMLPVMEAGVATPPGLMPCIVDQYERWLHFYPGSLLKGIGLYQYSSFMGSGDDKANIREQIKDLARLRGWGG